MAQLEALAEGCEKTGWRIHAWVMMRKHYHFLLETPEANLKREVRRSVSAPSNAVEMKYIPNSGTDFFTISFTSMPGQGTNFIVRLKLFAASQTNRRKKAQKTQKKTRKRAG